MGLRSELIVLAIIIINTIVAISYMVIMGIRTRLPHVYFRGVTMLCCPVIGAFCYLFGFIVDSVLSKDEVDYDNLSMDKTRQEFLAGIDKEQELEVIPLEEVLTVSVTKDRRRAMLNMLKRDISENLALVRKAVENDDSETSHYAASALTHVFGKYSAEMNELQVKYDKDRKDCKNNIEFLDVVLQILNSGGLIGVEETKYYYMYINLMLNLNEYHPEAITDTYYAMMVKALRSVGRIMDAEKWAERSLEQRPDSEQSYLNVMYVKYILGKEAEFQDVLDRLRRSNIALSRKGLDIVRYWIAR